jgi:hypothetical protein
VQFVLFLVFSSCVKNPGNLGLPAVRSVAQPGSALDWGSRGRRFESGHSDQEFEDSGDLRPSLSVPQAVQGDKPGKQSLINGLDSLLPGCRSLGLIASLPLYKGHRILVETEKWQIKHPKDFLPRSCVRRD